MNTAQYDMALGEYRPGSSFLHRLDPRVKLLGLITALVLGFTASPLQCAAGLVCATCTAWASGVGARPYFRAVKRFALMIAVTGALNALLHGSGTRLILYGFNVGMTDEGIVRAAVLMGSIVQAIVIATVFSVTTEPGSLTKALTRLGRDMRMQSLEKVGFTLTLGLRFVPMIQWEVRNVMEAQKARGGDFGRTSVMSRIRASAAALVPAIRIATARADRLAAAMVTRGFQFGKPRTEYKPLRMKYPDYAALMVLLGLLVLKLIFSGAA